MAQRQTRALTQTAFDLTGLATLGNGVGWISNKITNIASSLLPDIFKVYYKFTCGTVVVGQGIEIYLIEVDNNGSPTFVSGNLALTGAGQLTSTGGVLPTNMTASLLRDQVTLLRPQIMSVTTTGTVYADGFEMDARSPYFALYIYNNSGAALSAATLSYLPYTDDIA